MTKTIHHRITLRNLNENDQSLPPIIDRDDNNEITSISCDDSTFSETTLSEGMAIKYFNPDSNITIPLSEPILTDVVVRFDYDAYFKDDTSDTEQLSAIREIKNKIFATVLKQSPLSVAKDSGGTSIENIIVTDLTCDLLLENTLKSMLSSMGLNVEKDGGDDGTNQNAILRLSDFSDYEWDYFLGWENYPDDAFSANPNCTSAHSFKDTTCKPISSSLTAQVPTIRDLDENTVKTQILQLIKKGFEQNAFLTEDVPIMKFVGTQDGFLSKPQDTLEGQKTFRDHVARVMSSFGISATAVLGFITLFSCGLFGYKLSQRKQSSGGSSNSSSSSIDNPRSNRRRGRDWKEGDKQVSMRNIINSSSNNPELDKPEQAKARATITQESNDGIEIVDMNLNTADEKSNVQTGFGMSLGAFMDSLRGNKDEVDSNCGSSTLDKLELNDRDYDDLLDIENSKDQQSKKEMLSPPPSPSRVRSIVSRLHIV